MNSPDRQMIQTAAHLLPSVGTICSQTHQSGKDIMLHHWAGEDLVDQFTFQRSEMTLRAAGAWPRLVLVVCDLGRLWDAGGTPSSVSSWWSRQPFLYCFVSLPPILPQGCSSDRQGMTNPPRRLCAGGATLPSSTPGLQVLLPLEQWHTDRKKMSKL